MNSFPYARGGSQRGRRTVAEEVYANRTMGGNNKYPQQQSSGSGKSYSGCIYHWLSL